MMYQQTTQVPNIVFDTHLPSLTESELKLLLIIIRQTNGWYDKATGRRKTRDRISHGQFIKKTRLSRRVIAKALKSLIEKNLVTVTSENGKMVHRAEERKGVARLFYSFLQEPVRPKASRLDCKQFAGVGKGKIFQGREVVFSRLLHSKEVLSRSNV